MTRVEPEIKHPVIVPRSDYEIDLKRGYCILEHRPAYTEVLTDPTSGRKIEREVKQVLVYRCMYCQFDCVDCDYTNDRTGLDIIRTHIFRGEHPWRYAPFFSPYGHVSDVVIEGIEDYTTVMKGD